jgi:hypothetical protein
MEGAMHFIMVTFIIALALCLTAVLFIVWVIAAIFRGITRLFLGPGLKQRVMLPPRDAPHTRRCGRDSCKSLNPVEARFCRRCGQRMEDPQRVAVRRAAML